MSAPVTAASALTLDVERHGGIITIKCHGRIVSGVTDTLSTRVRELLPGSKQIILDLTDVSHMDSMGIGTCVRLYVSAKSAGSSLQLINLAPRVRQVLGITNLLSVLCDMCEKGVSVRF
jgi:anti-sigma B factor antagonist